MSFFRLRFRFLLSIGSVQENLECTELVKYFPLKHELPTDPCEYQDRPAPLVGQETVAEQDDGAEDSEELPGGRDDGAGEGAELWDAHEDEKLQQTNNQRRFPRQLCYLAQSAGYREAGQMP